MRKLTSAVQTNINRASTRDSWDLEELHSAVEREIELLSAAEQADGFTQQRRQFYSKVSVSASKNQMMIFPYNPITLVSLHFVMGTIK